MKFMNMKRFGSMAMAGVLALSLTVPAFAADPSTTIEGGYEEIPIAVTVPTTGTAKINPYGLPVKMGKSDESTVNITNQQINHEVLAIRNNGDVGLDVNVSSLVIVPKGDLAIGSTKDTGKTIKVDLEIAGLNDPKYAVSSESESLNDLLIDAFAANATWASAGTLGAPVAAKGAAASAITAAKSNAALASLGASTVTADGVTYGNSSIALFRLKGDMAQSPVKTDGSDDPWASTDGFTATIVFKFTPTPSAGDASVTVAISGTTATATFNAGTSGLTATSYAWDSSDTGVATVAGTSANGTITQVGGATAGQTSVITVTVTLSNGAKVTGNATYTAA